MGGFPFAGNAKRASHAQCDLHFAESKAVSVPPEATRKVADGATSGPVTGDRQFPWPERASETVSEAESLPSKEPRMNEAREIERQQQSTAESVNDSGSLFNRVVRRLLNSPPAPKPTKKKGDRSKRAIPPVPATGQRERAG